MANADQLLIVAAWVHPPVWLELIDRYLIAAERYRLSPVICINKIDLAQDVDGLPCSASPLQRLGLPRGVFQCSSRALAWMSCEAFCAGGRRCWRVYRGWASPRSWQPCSRACISASRR